ncbi:hypothetical protein [Streptomyces sp. NPDC005423]|uniref:hypothetical protein n=1 Tax=Streptomyces sp. NPDC005423 TaxID=3155343 RepID=UPI0033A54BC8
MRRSTLRPALALAVLALALAGCDSTSDTGSATVSPSPTATPTPTPTPSSSASGRPDCTPKTSLAAADGNGTFCLTEGGTVRVLLDGTAARPWTPVSTAGTGLEATNGGIMIRAGDASSAFRAVSAGTVELTASRPLCATAPHKISCKGIQEWRATVVVTAK